MEAEGGQTSVAIWNKIAEIQERGEKTYAVKDKGNKGV